MSQQVDDMRCGTVDEHIESFIDGELATDLSIRLRRHLDRCPACADRVERARSTMAALRSLPELDAPPRVLHQVRAEVAGSRPRRPRRRRLRLAAAAAVLLSVTGGLYAVRHAQRGPDPEAVRAAAELEYALARLGEITRRANHLAADRVLRRGALPSAVGGLAGSLGLAQPPTDGSNPGSSESTEQGSS
jgi:anti-sigma factor RsiW